MERVFAKHPVFQVHHTHIFRNWHETGP